MRTFVRGGGRRFITEVVACPDCGCEADPVVGGDHGGACLPVDEVSRGDGRDAQVKGKR